MKPNTTTAITAVNHQMKLQEWAKQIEARRASGMTVQNWCAENGMSVKTYYYHLRKVREQCVESAPEIVPLTLPQQTNVINFCKIKWLIIAVILIIEMHFTVLVTNRISEF